MRLLPLLLLAFLLVSCDSAETPTPTPDPPSPIVAGVDLDVLLAPPTSADLQAITNNLAERAENVVLLSTQLEEVHRYEGATLRVLSFGAAYPGGLGRMYGAVRVPDADGPVPVLVVVPDGEGDVSLDDFLTSGAFTTVGETFAQVVFVPPGSALRIGGATYTGGPFQGPAHVLSDFEVDLTRAFLRTLLVSSGSPLDAQRVGYVGFGRGGSVALLMATRPALPNASFAPRVVAALAPFTDYTAPSFRNVVRRLLLDQLTEFPGGEDLARRVLHPLRDGERSMGDARRDLLRRSPIFWAGALPSLYLRHGADDFVIGSDHSARLADAVPTANIEIFPEVGHSALLYDENVRRNLATYLMDRLGD